MMVFFFQAEDGIRDIGVTGVQTCALPILPGWFLGLLSRINGERAAELTRLAAALDAERERTAHAAVVAERTRVAREVHDRSEERRVGQEGRSRWSPYH